MHIYSSRGPTTIPLFYLAAKPPKKCVFLPPKEAIQLSHSYGLVSLLTQ